MIKKLLVAAETGNIEFLSKNLNHENINLFDDHGYSVAIVAARRNDFEVIKLLSKYGVDFNQKSKAGQSALDWATLHKNTEMINFINQYSATSKPMLGM